MRKVLFVLCLSVALSACEKEKEYCWTCEIVATTTNNIGHPATTSTFAIEVCEKTQDEITEYEKNSTKTTTGSTGNIILTTHAVTTCKKK